MKKKFELTNETMVKYGRTFYRIRALIDIQFSWGSVKKGDFGGYIEKEEILTHEGNAWVFENGLATSDCKIWGGVIWGGEIRGGVIWGGKIWGGVIWGGEIWGGVIRGGEIWGGKIWGGEIMGGVIMGGVIRDGVIRDGVIWGGKIWGGEIWGGEIWGGEIRGGETIKKSPIFLAGLRWPVTITEQHITIGCEQHLHGDWKKFSTKEIAAMSGKESLKFWNEHKKMIMSLAKIHAN